MSGGTSNLRQITASTGVANAIDLTGNSGATINFTGGLDLTAGGLAFNAVDGGTLSVTGTTIRSRRASAQASRACASAAPAW